MKGTGSWLALAALLAALVAGAATFDRRSWPGLVGDEATYLMQAQSLAWDGDLLYGRGDFDRFVAQWGRKPEGLILQSGDGGRTVGYGKPPAYAVYLAPFLRLAPIRGVAIANALLLALTACACARALRRTLGPASPLWVAVWVFGSAAFATFTWAHSDLFLMDLVALALALVYGAPDPRDERKGEGSAGEQVLEGRGRTALRGLGAGILLGLAAAARPFYGALALPLLLAFPRGGGARPTSRWAGAGAFLLGLALVVLPGAMSLAQGGSWSPEYGGERQSFDSSTGFPDVDPGADDLKAAIAERGNHSWRPGEFAFEKRQTSWNALYFFAGRHVGILPYFLPLLLGAAAYRGGRGRILLPTLALAAAACFLVIRPFNFYGGGGAIANRYFLPLYPAFWFLAGRRPRGEVVKPLLAALLAAPFLLPLWSHPRAYLLDGDGGYSYVSDTARALLPYETTLSHLKPSGRDDFVHGPLWAKPLTTNLRAEEGGAAIHLGPGRPGQILLGSPHPVPYLEVRSRPPAGPLGVSVPFPGAGEAAPGSAPDPAIAVRLARARAVHKMWWTDDPFYLYQLDLRLPEGGPEGGVTFTIRPLDGPPAPGKP